jgi:hypothetical protein
MGFERHRVTVNGEVVGWVGYSSTSDTWCHSVVPTIEECSRRAPWVDCTHPPDVDGEPHAHVMAAVDHEAFGLHCELLYCPTCRAIIPPPHDGYVYLDYPAEWLAVAAARSPAPREDEDERMKTMGGDPECICKGNWRKIVAEHENLIGAQYEDEKGNAYTFFGLVHGDDDYYYGMSSKAGVSLLSCVGSIEGHGLRPRPLAAARLPRKDT